MLRAPGKHRPRARGGRARGDPGRGLEQGPGSRRRALRGLRSPRRRTRRSPLLPVVRSARPLRRRPQPRSGADVPTTRPATRDLRSGGGGSARRSPPRSPSTCVPSAAVASAWLSASEKSTAAWIPGVGLKGPRGPEWGQRAAEPEYRSGESNTPTSETQNPSHPELRLRELAVGEQAERDAEVNLRPLRALLAEA